MKSIKEQLSRYKSVHLDAKNIKTHFIGIPFIVLAVTILLNAVKFVFTPEGATTDDGDIYFTLAMVVFVFVFIYYLLLHRLLAFGMLVYMAINLYVAHLMSGTIVSIYIALALFFVGWVFQFIGHYYEKAKPAFIDDLSQFLIGPLFLMAEVYFALGFEKKLNAEVTVLAFDKRKALDEKSI